MRIGIDCRQIYDVKKNQGAGIERYVYFLVKNILSQSDNNKYILFFDDQISQETIDSLLTIRKFKIVTTKDRFPFLSRHVLFTFKLWSEWLQWMIFPANVMPFLYVGKSLLVIHDLAIYNHPEWFEHGQWFSRLLVVPSSVAKATKIITVSQTTKEDLLELFKFRRERKIKVVYPGVAAKNFYSDIVAQKTLAKFKIKTAYLLFVGTIEPRKNLVRLAEAFKKVIESRQQEIQLVIAGGKGWKDKKIFSKFNEINEYFHKKVINYIGKITDEEKNILMQNAKIFVFPSLYEGFGLPVLEAMTNGCPVIASKFSATGEYIHREAIKINPYYKNEIYLAIKKILANKVLSEDLVEKGYQLIKKFNWSQTARQISEFITKYNQHNQNQL